ncbi:unnamed protein product [Rotaria socialis]|uniref:Amine oxidase n=1 Tax=Rotaria socialis TaxID=392032 RepID=A0A820YF14_9BILA|nr:unnamed protein product [Rotaria socialis]
MAEETIVDVIVVGAGISGLYAAYRLQQKAPELKILVLEAKDRVGGRTLTADLKTSRDGNETDRFDLGGQWVTDTQENITALLNELELETYPQYHTGKSIAELCRHIKQYALPIPFISLLSFLESIYNVFRLENLVSTVPTWNPMMTRNADYLDQHTLADLMKPCIRNSAKPLFAAAVRTIFGCEPEQLNALFALTYAQASGGFMRLTLTDPGCAQEKKIKGGSQQISQILVERIGTEHVRLETPVQKIVQKEDGTILVTTTQNQATIQCRKVILAIPPSQIIPIQFEPMLPGYKRELFKHMPIGSYLKFIFIFDKAFWREDGLSGEVVSDGSFTSLGLSIGPLNYLIDGTSSNGTPALIGFIGGRCASVWTSVTFEERRKALTECLSRYFGGHKITSHLIEYVEKDWNLEPYSGGCPCHNVTTGSMKDFVDGLRKPFTNIHFASTETASQWMGYMDGAVDAGRRAASEILVSFRDNNQSKDYEIDSYTYESQNKRMASLFVRQLWSGIGCSSILRPTVNIQPSIRTKMVRRVNRHRVPTHTKPSDRWAQKKTVARIMEADAIYDDEFAKRKPIDKIWLAKEYPVRSWSLETVLEWHREMVQPRMLNSMDSFVWARLKLDMTTPKKTKFVENVRGLVTFPHYFEDRPRKNVVLFCRLPEHIKAAEKHGAYMSGYTEVIKQFERGDVTDTNYEYVLCAPDVYADILHLRKKISKDKFPNPQYGSLHPNVDKMLEKFIRGKEYQSVKYEEARGILELRFGIINMPQEQLIENFQALIEQVSTHSQTKVGPFVTGCSVYCPPSTEEFRVDVTPFLPSDEDVIESKELEKQVVDDLIKKSAPEIGDDILKALPPVK